MDDDVASCVISASSIFNIVTFEEVLAFQLSGRVDSMSLYTKSLNESSGKPDFIHIPRDFLNDSKLEQSATPAYSPLILSSTASIVS